MAVIKYNLRENKQLKNRLLYEAPLVASMADQYKNWTPEEPWTGEFAKYESLLKAVGAKPYPRPYGKKANYEVFVGDDYIRFYDNGTAYSTNNAEEMKYGVDEEKRYNGIILYNEEGGQKQIHGAIEMGPNGKPKWTPPAAEDAVKEQPETWVDYLQLALDVVGLIPGYGDIADIINAAISFGRGNYLEGFLSLIGAIPVVGSVISIPLKAILKTFNKAGDVFKTAWRGKKSADEVWIFIKNSGKLGPKELDSLVKGMGDVSDYISKFRKDADWALPNNAASALDEFSAFLKKNSVEAEKIFSGAAKQTDSAAKGILKVRKELDQIGGLEKLLGGRIFRRVRNFFSSALSTKELNALRGAMEIKFFKNMNNPGKLSILCATDPKLAKTTLRALTIDAADWIKKMSNAPTVGNFVPSKRAANLMKEWDTITATHKASPSKLLEQRLAWLQKNNPDLYSKAHKNIVDMAQKSDNPLYKQFMNNEINGLGSYFSKDYTDIAGLSSAKERWSNLAPVVYNELSDMGEDALMSAGIETKDDVNGLFWPLVKSAVVASKPIPVIGDFTSWLTDTVGPKASALAKYVADDPVLGSFVNQIKQATGADAGKAYDPNVEFEIVPQDSPELKKQEKEKEQRIQQNKGFF